MSDGLPSYLGRGATPATPSFQQKRISIGIKNATAGANADSAFASYDDNELSGWVNDGKLNTAWIEYELERTALISEVNLKLNNFRTRTYNLSISVDGKEVSRDTTQRSLGYFNIAFKPVQGKKVMIKLLQPAKAIVDNATEVSGKKLDDGLSRPAADVAGGLGIIEVEVYEVVKHQ
jgi:hypothetical protein